MWAPSNRGVPRSKKLLRRVDPRRSRTCSVASNPVMMNMVPMSPTTHALPPRAAALRARACVSPRALAAPRFLNESLSALARASGACLLRGIKSGGFGLAVA